MVSVQVFQEKEGALAREALVVEGNAVATQLAQQEDVAAVEAAHGMPEAAQDAARGPAERTTEALEVTRTTHCSAPVKSNPLYLLSCWLHPELDLLSYPYPGLTQSYACPDEEAQSTVKQVL